MHAQVKRYLDVRRGRVAGLVALEGRWALQRARAAGVEIEAVITCPALLRGDGPDDATVEVGEKTFRRLVARDGPDGVASIARVPTPTLDGLEPGDRILVADGVEAPGNIGTLIRTADGAAAAAVIVCDTSLRVSNPALVRAPMGAVLWVPVVVTTVVEARAWLRAHDVRAIAADPAAPTSYRRAEYGPPVALVVGNERRGLTGGWGTTVAIPMLGRSDSLNVGHAAALLLYEALHQQARRT